MQYRLHMAHSTRPRIGITADIARDEHGRARHQVRATYIDAVIAAGGLPIILPADANLRAELIAAVDGVIIIGGDDVDTRPLGIPLHPQAKVMDAARQVADFALLKQLDVTREMPVLGICLGMQLMGIHHGAELIQHLGDQLPDSDRHRNDYQHMVTSSLGDGLVASSHHQALGSAAHLEVIGVSDDGVIEAIRDAARPFYVGVQWHPERTEDKSMGLGVIRRLVDAARRE
jgi:putative glutamine amidotransferase